ncbi:Ribosomal large subunit pseudouridine synthase B [termite gut metagenome]|uniref:Ribosomal large subunit pseudouridine synthase B n=1 Tax=termite gut metagenome TaxID=433724 RepID=A0A5J4RU53_9ZZZZ
MSTEEESRHEDSQEEKKDADRTGGYNKDRSFNKDGYIRRDDNRPSYNRDNNYRREGQRPYGDRPQRPYNSYNNRENGDRSQRPDYSREGGFQRGERPSYNNDRNGERPARPYNNNRENGDRPQRPYHNQGYHEGGDRPQRPYNREDRPWRSGNEERKPWQKNTGDDSGNRPYFRPPSGGYGNASSHNNDRNGEDDRPRRPRFNPNDSRPSSQGYSRTFHRTADYDPNAKYSKKKQMEYKSLFVDPNEPIRLNKYLANAGICSRREADEFITAGVVTVNDAVITELGTKIKRSDVVKFHDETVSIEHKVYILLNKPKDCVTTSDDPQARLTVMDLIKGACNERVYPVGRLDRNTTGVLLLTNDGDLASKLTHPKYLKKKVYIVHTDKNITKHDMEQIVSGIQLEDGEAHADEISYTDETRRNQVGIEIHSGKNRIVRRIFESLGYKITKLDRVLFAGLTKKGVQRGEWRYLTEKEVGFLKMGSFE